MKPFKPPSLISRPNSGSVSKQSGYEPPLKKRRISHDRDAADTDAIAAAARILTQKNGHNTFQNPVRKPLAAVQNTNSILTPSNQPKGANDGYFTVLWYLIQSHPVAKPS
jgi:hypothetical protein